MATKEIVFDEPGVVANQEDPARDGFGFQYAERTDDTWTFYGPGTNTTVMEVDQVIDHPETASMDITSNGVTYTVRPVRFEDGYWLSEYKIGLNEEILGGLVLYTAGGGDMMYEGERLIARYSDEADFVLEVLYLNALGVWARQYGTFFRVSDELAGHDDFQTLEIDPDRAEEFLEEYDRRQMRVDETRDFAVVGGAAPAVEPEAETTEVVEDDTTEDVE